MALSTILINASPHILCRTLGRADLIRRPLPPANIIALDVLIAA